MEIILSTIYAIIFLLIIRKLSFYRITGSGKYASEYLYAAKMAAGIALGLVYTYYYTDRHTADTFRLFDDSAVVFNTLQTSPLDFFRIVTGIGGDAPHLDVVYNRMHNWYDIYSPVNDNRFMIRLNTILRFFSFGHYYVHVIFAAFLSLTGTVALIRFSSQWITGMDRTLFLVLGFLPSVLFWGSGLMKDAIVIFALGLTLYFFGKLLQGSKNNRNAALFLASVILLTFSRFQVMTVILPGLIAWFITSSFGVKPILSFTGTIGCFLLASAAMPVIDLPGLLYAKQQSFLKLASDSDAGSMIKAIPFQPDITSILLNAPLGFLTSLTRPFLHDRDNAFLLLCAIENAVILTFCGYCLLNSSLNAAFRKPFFWFSLFFVIISFSLIGLVSPVLGAMVRYKTPALPFLMIAFIHLLRPDKKSQLEQFTKKLPF